MLRLTDQYFWNIVFGLFFLILASLGVIILSTEAYKDPAALTLLDFLLITLATQRFTRLFVYDSMTKFFREQFYDAVEGKRGEVLLVKPANGPRRTLADLMTCPWCFGVWAASTITFFYLLTPYAYVPTLILAIASVASMLQLFANALGHRAEQLKRENELR